ncbi:MAG: hypothetical protein J6Y16_08320 [Treponema sp.]|nr:hypothetical protein [Treponema sp.]
MSISKKSLSLIIFEILAIVVLSVFVSCKRKGKETAVEGKTEREITYSKIPERFSSINWNSNDGKISFTIADGWKDKSGMTAVYELWCGDGRFFAGGLFRYSDGGTDSQGNTYPRCLILEPYDDNKTDFSASNGPDQDKQAMLDYMFPNKERCIIEFDPNYLNYSNKGAFLYKDSAFYDSSFTLDLTSGSETIIEGYPAVYLGNKSYTAKDKTTVHTEPDISSTKIPVKTINWSRHADEQKVEKLYEDNTSIFDWYRGLELCVTGRTSEKANVNGVEDYWYYIYYSNGHYWVFGGDIEPWDDSKNKEYDAALIEHGIKDGLIKLNYVDYSKLPKDMTYIGIGEEGESAIYYNDNEIYYVLPYMGVYAKYDRSRMTTDKDGFMKFKYGAKENESFLFIQGTQINQFFTNFQNDGRLSYRDEEEDDLQRYHSYYFKNISASSSFSETLSGRKVEYSPENLEKCFEVGCKCHPYWWNYSHIPWVEGAEGNGIGESITVEFTDNMVGMSVLNGYTDINKLKLYKENARLKEVVIDDLENGDSWTVRFEDRVYFNYISFPKKTKKIKMTIKSVYEGTKYSDTCVSAIIPCKTTPTLMDDEELKEYRERIFTNLKEVVRDCDEISPEELVKRLEA